MSTDARTAVRAADVTDRHVEPLDSARLLLLQARAILRRETTRRPPRLPSEAFDEYLRVRARLDGLCASLLLSLRAFRGYVEEAPGEVSCTCAHAESMHAFALLDANDGGGMHCRISTCPCGNPEAQEGSLRCRCSHTQASHAVECSWCSCTEFKP